MEPAVWWKRIFFTHEAVRQIEPLAGAHESSSRGGSRCPVGRTHGGRRPVTSFQSDHLVTSFQSLSFPRVLVTSFQSLSFPRKYSVLKLLLLLIFLFMLDDSSFLFLKNTYFIGIYFITKKLKHNL
jgi:hypothetical protein